MKRRRLNFCVALGIAVAAMACATAWAEPLQRNRISAEAIWFVHVDLDRFKQTEVGRQFLTELERPGIQDRLAIFQAIFNFDPRKTLQGCTLYSRGVAPEDAVLLLQGDFDADRLVALAKAGKEYESITHGRHTIHGWRDEKRSAKEGGNRRTYGAIHSSGAVILGQKSSRIGEALDVLDGVQASLDRSPQFADLGPAAQSGFLLAAARHADVSKLPPKAAMLRHLKTLTLSAGEKAGDFVLELVAEAQDTEAARNIQAVAQGMIAWALLQSEKPELTRLAQGATITRQETAVRGTLALPVSKVVQLLKDAAARRAAKR